MISYEIRAAELRPHILIEELIARHGAWRVVVALVAGLMAPRRRRHQADRLGNHLRRDPWF